jgi:hypothetical protein
VSAEQQVQQHVHVLGVASTCVQQTCCKHNTVLCWERIYKQAVQPAQCDRHTLLSHSRNNNICKNHAHHKLLLLAWKQQSYASGNCLKQSPDHISTFSQQASPDMQKLAQNTDPRISAPDRVNQRIYPKPCTAHASCSTAMCIASASICNLLQHLLLAITIHSCTSVSKKAMQANLQKFSPCKPIEALNIQCAKHQPSTIRHPDRRA